MLTNVYLPVDLIFWGILPDQRLQRKVSVSPLHNLSDVSAAGVQ